jgi:hypothetical protein
VLSVRQSTQVGMRLPDLLDCSAVSLAASRGSVGLIKILGDAGQWLRIGLKQLPGRHSHPFWFVACLLDCC